MDPSTWQKIKVGVARVRQASFIDRYTLWSALGRGRELWINAPDAGRHEIVPHVRWPGGVADCDAVFKTARGYNKARSI